MIIALTGVSGSGKDEIAKHLCSVYKMERRAFADKLKRAAAIIFDLSWEQLWGEQKDVVDVRWGYTPAQLLQRLGSECVRDGFADVPFIGKDVWVKAATTGLNLYDNYVFTDTRYPNEAEALRRLDACIVRVIRPGYKSKRASHVSEHALDDYPVGRVIVNDGTLEELYTRADNLYMSLL
jgi:hypothetical protein